MSEDKTGIQKKRERLLRALNVGNSVAEYDKDLQRYFLETDCFQELVEDRVDIIMGDKGSGKSAIFKYISDNTAALEQLKGIVVLPGFNIKGDPVFKRLAETETLTENQYISVWKAYLLSLVGSWVLPFYEGDANPPQDAIDLAEMLKALDLRTRPEAPERSFKHISRWIKRIVSPRKVGVELTFNELGLPVVIPTASYSATTESADDDDHDDDDRPDVVAPEKALSILDTLVGAYGVTAWVFLDRLDEAFIGHGDIERPALRALFRTHLDLAEYKNIRFKIFIRRDLFSKIMKGGFVNLTHVKARLEEINWYDEDLLSLLCQRMTQCEKFRRMAVAEGCPAQGRDLFEKVLPAYVDNKRQTTWQWMQSKTRDGNKLIQPRNLIDLLVFARKQQLRQERLRPYDRLFPLIRREAFVNAFDQLSTWRVQDTVESEVETEVANCIHCLRDAKAEHNDETLGAAFSIEGSKLKLVIEALIEIGFLEHRNGTYRVPMLYRKGLNIKQGKAF